jgi:hypothetical protein
MASAERPPPAVRLRAEGIRLPYGQLPTAVHAWVERELGAQVTQARTLAGGISPGCAARLCTADGRVFFLKAVGAGLNPDTPGLFRQEISVLRLLPRAPYRPALLATFDHGSWVGLLMEHVAGWHPDFADAHDTSAAWRAVRAQARELTPGPAGLRITTMREMALRWAGRWRAVAADPGRYLPGWAAARRARGPAHRPADRHRRVAGLAQP